MAKYADGIYGGERVMKKRNTIGGMLQAAGLAISQFIFGAIAAVIIVVLIIPIIVYVIVCLLFGKEPTIRIPNFIRNRQPKKVA